MNKSSKQREIKELKLKSEYLIKNFCNKIDKLSISSSSQSLLNDHQNQNKRRKRTICELDSFNGIDSSIEQCDIDDDLFIDENEILSFLNEYYVLFTDKLPKPEFL
jgi:hypothetical protein